MIVKPSPDFLKYVLLIIHP